MIANDQVTACIDGSVFAGPVCDYAAWASRRLDAPLTLLHIIDHRHASGPRDFSGSIGVGSQEALLEALAEHDHQTGRLALEQGRQMLTAAAARVAAAGVSGATTRQLHGQLVDRLIEIEGTVRLLVMGRRGTGAHGAQDHLGSNLERVVRAMHRPILIVPEHYRQPESVMLAFDNSASTRKGVEVLMRGPLFRGMACHVVTVGEPAGEIRRAYDWAREQLASAGFSVQGSMVLGDAETVLLSYQRDHAIDLLVMGAYGHSRIRQLLVGSTTTAMIRRTETPLLLLR